MGSQPFAALEAQGHEHGQKGKARLAGALEQLRWSTLSTKSFSCTHTANQHPSITCKNTHLVCSALVDLLSPQIMLADEQKAL